MIYKVLATKYRGLDMAFVIVAGLVVGISSAIVFGTILHCMVKIINSGEGFRLYMFDP